MQSTKARKIVSLTTLSIFFGAMIFLTVVCFDSLTEIVNDPVAFRERVAAYGLRGQLLFVLLMTAQVVLAIIPGQPFEIAAGASFGILLGTMLCLVGAAIGSAINFFLTRVFGLKIVKLFYSEEKLQKVFFLRESKRLNFFTFILFLIPGIPKDMLAYFMGITKIRFTSFIFFSTAGRLPGILLAALGGVAIQTGELIPIIIFIVILISFSLICLYISAKNDITLQNKNAQKQEERSSNSLAEKKK